MNFKKMPSNLAANSNSVFNKNERLATNIINPLPVSRFDLSFTHKTTFNSGYLVPIFCEEVLPADYWSIDLSTLLRLSTPQTSTMDSPIYDIAFFFVPFRVLWDNYIYFMGENKSAGYQEDFTHIPLINYDSPESSIFRYGSNDLASYLGFPQNVPMNSSANGLNISSLYFKAYGKIWNDYYRDENLDSEIDIWNNNNPDSDVNVSDYLGKTGADFHTLIQVGVGLAPVSKLSDYFTTCLPYQQKGLPVAINSLPLNQLVIRPIPITNSNLGRDYIFSPNWYSKYTGNWAPFSGASRSVIANANTDTGGTFFHVNTNDVQTNGVAGLNLQTIEATDAISFNGDALPYNINDLRLAIAMQHFLEKDARGGTRYIEYLFNHFGIEVSNSRLDRAEYIGGYRDNVIINNVVQSSSGDNLSPLGSVGGVSITTGFNKNLVNYAVKENGIIMGFVIVRSNISYSQGLPKKFTKTEKFDFYNPEFANIGEQPVYNYELYYNSTAGDINNAVFGYNEPWAEYRYNNNLLTGYLSVNSDLSLSSLYTYTENYSSQPNLTNSWMYYNNSIIGDTLLLNSSRAEFINDFMGDFYFKCLVDRRLPIYGVPGISKI